MTLVALSDVEQAEVRTAAEYVASLYRAGRVAHMKFTRADLTIEEAVLDGLGAERAVATHTGRPWGGGDPKLADVGERIDVRQTRHENGVLVGYEFDRPERVFVLAVGHFPSYDLRGWASGARIRTGPWHRKAGQNVPNGTSSFTASTTGYYVPQRWLWPIEGLLEAIAGREPVYSGFARAVATVKVSPARARRARLPRETAGAVAT